MKRSVASLRLVLCFGLFMAGCEETPKSAAVGTAPAPPPPPGSAPPPPPAETTSSPSSQAALPPETKVGVFAGGVDELAARPADAASPAAAPPPAPGTERVKAQAGVGAKGRSLDAYQGGILVTPAKAFFQAKERIAFEAQFKHQYDLYKAMEGAVPKDFADLKAKVLDPYQIKLPILPQGHKYVWDPENEELQVERPRQQ
jgi:hypothetical protein